MPQVREYGQLDVLTTMDGSGVALGGERVATRAPDASKARKIAWRVAIGLAVIAIWLAAAVNATA